METLFFLELKNWTYSFKVCKYFFSHTFPVGVVRLCSGEDICSMEGFTVDTRVEDLRHVWIPLTLKMSISKSQGLEISSWPEGEEVRRSTAQCRERNGTFLVPR